MSEEEKLSLHPFEKEFFSDNLESPITPSSESDGLVVLNKRLEDFIEKKLKRLKDKFSKQLSQAKTTSQAKVQKLQEEVESLEKKMEDLVIENQKLKIQSYLAKQKSQESEQKSEKKAKEKDSSFDLSEESQLDSNKSQKSNSQGNISIMSLQLYDNVTKQIQDFQEELEKNSSLGEERKSKLILQLKEYAKIQSNQKEEVANYSQKLESLISQLE